MKKALQFIIVTGIIIIISSYITVSSFVAMQVTNSVRLEITSFPEEYDLPYENVEFFARGTNIKLKGWYVPSLLPTERTIIITHGLNGNRSGNLELAKDLRNLNYNVLLYDIRGHGESEGERFNGGFIERFDLLGAFDYIENLPTDPSKIGILGFSLGAGISLMAAGEENKIAAVVTDSAFADIADLVVQETERRTSLPKWIVPSIIPGMTTATKLFYGIDIDDISPIKAIPKLDFPILLIHPIDDDRIPHSHSVRLMNQSINPNSELWSVPDVPHAAIYTNKPKIYLQKLNLYFNSQLK